MKISDLVVSTDPAEGLVANQRAHYARRLTDSPATSTYVLRTIRDGSASIVAWVPRGADAARLVACVNACKGLAVGGQVVDDRVHGWSV